VVLNGRGSSLHGRRAPQADCREAGSSAGQGQGHRQIFSRFRYTSLVSRAVANTTFTQDIEGSLQEFKMGVEESVYLAKLAEQAERYEGTCSLVEDTGRGS
jgi:hypothetical protein